MELHLPTYSLEVFTANYHISGSMQPRGPISVFINDVQYPCLALTDASVQPLMSGAKVGTMQSAEIYIPKTEIQIVVVNDLAPADAQLLTGKKPLIVFTDTYVMRGNFHTGPETKPIDLFWFGGGPCYGATDVNIFGVRPLAREINIQAPIAYIHRSAVQSFYSDASAATG
jgi:hypothetical protein